MSDIIAARVAEIREQLAAATPGEWFVSDENTLNGCDYQIGCDGRDGRRRVLAELNYHFEYKADAAFIAAAPSSIKFLLGEVSSLAESLREAHAAEMLADRDREEANARHNRTLTELRQIAASDVRLRSELETARAAQQELKSAAEAFVAASDAYARYQEGDDDVTRMMRFGDSLSHLRALLADSSANPQAATESQPDESRLTLICDHCGARSGPAFDVSLGEQCAACRRGFMRLIQARVAFGESSSGDELK